MAHPIHGSLSHRTGHSKAQARIFFSRRIDGLHDTLDLIRDSSAAMAAHKFQIGQAVELRHALSRNVPGGIYVVTKQLPEGTGELECRVKSVKEPHERVVRESELKQS